MKTTIIILTALLFVAVSEAEDMKRSTEQKHPVPMLFTFTFTAQDVVQDSIHKVQQTTNTFSVEFQFTGAGVNKLRSFEETHQNQYVRHKIGEFMTPALLLQSTNTSAVTNYQGITDRDANAIIKGLKMK